MSATEHMRAMLDGLMGTARDGTEAKRQHLHFTDSRVCRAFLLDCCPHDIFASTKLELGECSKVHDPALRADYLLANKKEDLRYEKSALERVQGFVNDADKKTDYLKRKLAETQEELTAEEANKLNRVHELTEKLGKKLAEVEKAELDGDMEAKKKFLDESEKIKKERAVAEAEYKEVSRPASSHQHQNLRVCDVCSAYLGINDNDSRLADHYGGKLHLGFITVREKLEDLKKRCAEKSLRRDMDHGRDRHHRDREREHDRNRDHIRARENNRDRERDRGRDRDRERDRDRDRDRTRDDDYRDRDRSRSSSRYYREPQRYGSRSRESHRDYAPRDHISRDYHRYRDDRVERDRERERNDRYDRSDRSERHSASSRSGRAPFERSEASRYDERDIAYQRRLRDWEKREVEKTRKFAIRELEEREKKSLEEQESKKLKEFLEDYKDDRDDMRFYRGSALARRLEDRRKEHEQDESARQKEKLELEMLSRSCAMNNSTPQPIEIANNDDGANSSAHSDTNGGNLSEPHDSMAISNHKTEPLNHNATSSSATRQQPSITGNPSVKGSNSVDKRKLVEELIGKIPTDKDQLFAQKLDWSLLDDNLMERRIRPWVTKKIAEYMGEKEADLIDFVCTLLNDHKDGDSMLKEVAIVLDDEAEKFVCHLWRLLLFELEAKKIGLRK